MKFCPKCLMNMPIEAFNHMHWADDEKQVWCKYCMRKYNEGTNPVFQRFYDLAGGKRAYFSMTKAERKMFRAITREAWNAGRQGGAVALR